MRALAVSPRSTVSSRDAPLGRDPHERAAQYIAAALRSAGCDVTTQAFDIAGHPRRTGLNVIGRLPGEAGRLPAVLVGAHYDTRPASPGADDNASGVAAMLECARLLAGRRLRKDVLFVAFDAEERQDPGDGLRGSSAYVASLQRTASGTPAAEGKAAAPVGEAVILEMVGYSSGRGTQKVTTGFTAIFPLQALRVYRRGRRGDFLIALSQGRSNNLARALEAQSGKGPGPRILPLMLPGWMPKPNDLLRSDHAPFWRAGIPAIMVGDTANFRNPNYHLPSDTPDTLDFDMLAGFAVSLAAVVAERASQA